MTAANLVSTAVPIVTLGLVFGVGAAGLATVAAMLAFVAGVMAERSDHADR